MRSTPPARPRWRWASFTRNLRHRRGRLRRRLSRQGQGDAARSISASARPPRSRRRSTSRTASSTHRARSGRARRGGAGRGARPGRDGAALGEAPVSPLRRAGAEAGRARFSGVVALARDLAPVVATRPRSPTRSSRPRLPARPAPKASLEAPRARLDARQAEGGGPGAFYKGEIAAEIVAAVKKAGGVMETTIRPPTPRSSASRCRRCIGPDDLHDAAASSGGIALVETIGVLGARFPKVTDLPVDGGGAVRPTSTRWSRRSSTASPIGPATSATPTSSPSTSPT